MTRNSRIPELALSAAAALLAAAVLYPLRPAEPPPRPTATHPKRELASQSATATSAGAFAVGEVSALFVPFAPAKKKAPKPPSKAPAPVEPTWLHYLAFAVDAKGSTLYVFKDDRTGRVLILSNSSTSDGWRLLSGTPGGFLLEKGGIRYLVKGGAR